MTTIDSARLALAAIDEQCLGAPSHGRPVRWDWGVTLATLEQAWRNRDRLQAIANALTPEQRAALWTTSDPRAAELRRLL